MFLSMEDSLGGSTESDDNYADITKIDPYEQKYYALLRRCEAIQQSNERLVNRIQHVRKQLKRLQRDRRFLMKRLDGHKDDYRNAQYAIDAELEDVKVKEEPLEEQPSSSSLIHSQLSKLLQQKQSSSSPPTSNEATRTESVTPKATGTKKKARHEKPEKDKNAPKRPANPFLLFCQDQRAVVLERMQEKILERKDEDGPQQISHQELTKGLAQNWNGLNPEQKKVYYNMYEREKERYEKEMFAYTNSSSIAASAGTNKGDEQSNQVVIPPVATVKVRPELINTINTQQAVITSMTGKSVVTTTTSDSVNAKPR